MEYPSELIRRAKANRSAQMPPQKQPDVPKPVPRHDSYTKLMRSHDRVRTQHLAGQDRKSGA